MELAQQKYTLFTNDTMIKYVKFNYVFDPIAAVHVLGLMAGITQVADKLNTKEKKIIKQLGINQSDMI